MNIYVQDVFENQRLGSVRAPRATFPTLTAEQIARQAFGRVEPVQKGKVLFERDDRTSDCFIVLVGPVNTRRMGRRSS